jgi:hypothetical protein
VTVVESDRVCQKKVVVVIAPEDSLRHSSNNRNKVPTVVTENMVPAVVTERM